MTVDSEATVESDVAYYTPSNDLATHLQTDEGDDDVFYPPHMITVDKARAYARERFATKISGAKEELANCRRTMDDLQAQLAPDKSRKKKTPTPIEARKATMLRNKLSRCQSKYDNATQRLKSQRNKCKRLARLLPVGAIRSVRLLPCGTKYEVILRRTFHIEDTNEQSE